MSQVFFYRSYIIFNIEKMHEMKPISVVLFVSIDVKEVSESVNDPGRRSAPWTQLLSVPETHPPPEMCHW